MRERVHKLCNRCGLVGHTRSQCTQSMEDVKMMLFRQRYHIQNLHQVHFSFDALETQFSNDLRAFYNRRRRRTSYICFGNIYHHHPFPQTTHPNPVNQNSPTQDAEFYHSPLTHTQSHATIQTPYPDPDTPQLRTDTNPMLNQSQHANNQSKSDHTNLNIAIHSLNLGNRSNPATPFNTPASSPSHTHTNPPNNDAEPPSPPQTEPPIASSKPL